MFISHISSVIYAASAIASALLLRKLFALRTAALSRSNNLR
jgi:hypothetical protein